MNLPNSITLSRIAAVPVFIWLLSPHSPVKGPGHQELAAAALFILAAITDGLDGYLARRRQQITTVGILLDPLADKLFVTAAYIVLVAYNPRIVPPWIAVLIVGREFLVSGLRSIAAAEGFTIAASDIGKLKTVIQIVSVVAAILAHRWIYWNLFGFILDVRLIAYTSIYWMTDRQHHLRPGLLLRLLEAHRPRQRARPHPPHLRPHPHRDPQATRRPRTPLPHLLTEPSTGSLQAAKRPEKPPDVCSRKISLRGYRTCATLALMKRKTFSSPCKLSHNLFRGRCHPPEVPSCPKISSPPWSPWQSSPPCSRGCLSSNSSAPPAAATSRADAAFFP